MRLIKNTTELIGIKDQNINISLVFETDIHIEIQAELDYPAPSCPHCHGKMIKYDFQKPSKIPLLEQAGTPTLLRLKKRRFQCKGCRRVTVAETSIVEKNCQISNLVRQKLTQLLTEKMSLTDIARRLRVSTSTVYRKLDQFTFKEHFDKLPRVMSWDEFGFKKGELAFVAQNYETNKLIVLRNRSQFPFLEPKLIPGHNSWEFVIMFLESKQIKLTISQWTSTREVFLLYQLVTRSQLGVV